MDLRSKLLETIAEIDKEKERLDLVREAINTILDADAPNGKVSLALAHNEHEKRKPRFKMQGNEPSMAEKAYELLLKEGKPLYPRVIALKLGYKGKDIKHKSTQFMAQAKHYKAVFYRFGYGYGLKSWKGRYPDMPKVTWHSSSSIYSPSEQAIINQMNALGRRAAHDEKESRA